MRFHIITAKTIRDLMSFKRVLAVTLVGLLPVFIMAVNWGGSNWAKNLSLEMASNTLVGYFMILIFMWMAGFYFAYVIATGGMEFISKEEETGTLLLMVSKPVGRFEFILGKYLALVITSLILQMLMLSSAIVLFWGVADLDPGIVGDMLELVPWLFIYAVIISILFAAITVFLATLIRGRATMIGISTVIIALIFLAGLITRIGWMDTYDGNSLYLIDPGYQLGNTYMALSESAESGQMIPKVQALFGMFTGGYKTGTEELVLTTFLGSSAIDPDIGAMQPSLDETSYIPPLISILFCLGVSGALLWGTKISIERKEVF